MGGAEVEVQCVAGEGVPREEAVSAVEEEVEVVEEEEVVMGVDGEGSGDTGVCGSGPAVRNGATRFTDLVFRNKLKYTERGSN